MKILLLENIVIPFVFWFIGFLMALSIRWSFRPNQHCEICEKELNIKREK